VGLKNEEVMDMIVRKFKGMENHFNTMEQELNKDATIEFNRTKVAMSLGKVTKMYEDVAFLLGVFDNKPKYKA